MTKKKKKSRKRKTESQKLSLKLAKEKIVRLIQKEEFEEMASQLDFLSNKLENNPELLAESFIYIAGKTSNHEIRTMLLERATELLGNFGINLAKLGQYEEAIKKFKRNLEIIPNDITTLNNYGLALHNLGQHDLAIEKFQQVLKINPSDTTVLKNYGLTLDNLGQHDLAIEKFQQVLKIIPDDTKALNNYGVALYHLDQHDLAIKKFQQVLRISPDDAKTLNNYALALYLLGQHDLAIEKFIQALKINPDDTETLSNYAVILAKADQVTEALKNFEKALAVTPYNPDTLFLYAAVLEGIGKFEDAISMLEKSETNTLSQDQINFVHLNLGRLHYLTKSETLGDKYFDLAIENSEDKDAERIKAVKHILAVRPYSEEAAKRLRQIIKESPRYAPQASKLLSLILFGEEHFRQFNTGSADELRDTEALARGIYHKMLNEISVLKNILYEITFSYQNTESIIGDIVQHVEDILAGISERRHLERKKVQKIPGNDYQGMIDIISKTAQDISDFVNNELFGLKSDIHYFQEDLKENDPIHQKLVKIVEQIEYAEIALNDLKSIHEGVTIRRSTFKIRQLFETWKGSQKFQQASIQLDIQNGETEFYGDEQKIRGFINELVENSVKHNPDKRDLDIKISSENTNNPMIESDTMLFRRQCLLVTFTDNGKGIPDDKKDWIFLPLKTTSEQGSGLGLFLIRRTLKEMDGYIEEDGSDGARFKIYIPYGEEA